MATQVPVVNESIPGKSWSVYWGLGDAPKTTTNGNNLTTNARFTCGEKVYTIKFHFFDNGCRLDLDFGTTKGNG
jgi:hypothetical protein